jgi:hypothetical protein
LGLIYRVFAHISQSEAKHHWPLVPTSQLGFAVLAFDSPFQRLGHLVPFLQLGEVADDGQTATPASFMDPWVPESLSRLFDDASQRRPTLLGLTRTVASSAPWLFSSDHGAADATMNGASPICIEPLQIERPGLSVAQTERIRWF